MKLKLAIVGSRAFTNENYVLKVVNRYITEVGKDHLTIVSGGCPDGADMLGKKIALDLGLEYVEFPPAHRFHNQYCILPAKVYNKPYHVKNYFERNSQVAAHCDHLVAFVIKGVRCNGTMDTFNKAKKLAKEVILFEEEIDKPQFYCGNYED